MRVRLFRLVLTVLAIGLSLPAALASDLIVTKDGKAIICASSETKGDTITYETRRDGVQTIPKDEVAGVITYLRKTDMLPRDEVTATIAEIDRLEAAYPSARKELGQVRFNWDKLEKQYAEAAKQAEGLIVKVDEQVARYTLSDRGPEIFNAVNSELQLIQLHDLTGTLTARLSTISNALKRDFLDRNLKRLAEMAADDDYSVGQYRRIKLLAETLLPHLPKKPQADVREILSYARYTTFNKAFTEAMALAGDTPGVDDYLDAASALRSLHASVAEAGQKKMIGDALRSLAAKLRDTQPQYDVSSRGAVGFPMTKEDTGFMTSNGGIYTYLEDERGGNSSPGAIMIPTVEHTPVVYTEALTLPVRLVFNHRPDPNREYQLFGQLLSDKMVFPVDAPVVVNGHADLTLSFSFKGLSKTALRAFKDEYGDRHTALLRLESRPAGKTGVKFSPLTRFMPIEFKLD